MATKYKWKFCNLFDLFKSYLRVAESNVCFLFVASISALLEVAEVNEHFEQPGENVMKADFLFVFRTSLHVIFLKVGVAPIW